jgi:hypothetical protein
MTKVNKVVPYELKQTPSYCGHDMESNTSELFEITFLHMESKWHIKW